MPFTTRWVFKNKTRTIKQINTLCLVDISNYILSYFDILFWADITGYIVALLASLVQYVLWYCVYIVLSVSKNQPVNQNVHRMFFSGVEAEPKCASI